jgi:hypothetical protein
VQEDGDINVASECGAIIGSQLFGCSVCVCERERTRELKIIKL